MAFTYFFRDMQTLETIRDYALPDLRSRRYINIWDAGCAMGLEPYSLSIVLRENIGYMYFRNVKIYASDIDNSNLFGKIISEGRYPRDQIARIPKDILDKYFIADDDENNFTLNSEIMKSVCFQKHDLLSLKPIRENINLILCKNVLLHFTGKERINVYTMFHNALADGGYLATEQTQKLPDEVKYMFEPVVSNAQLYRKV